MGRRPPRSRAVDELLVSSYALAAHRIEAVLNGHASVRSRVTDLELASPVGLARQVIGLCGQGGKHVYFKLQRSHLEACVRGILDHSLLPVDPSAELDRMLGLCKGLRALTTFFNPRDCVNHRCPDIVPLMAPEEIWLDGTELPLDVWRLISYEHDLLSSAASSPVRVSDRSQVSLTAAALAFAQVMNTTGRRPVTFALKTKALPKREKKAAQPAIVKTSLRRLLYEAGRLLTPIEEHPMTPWFAAVRYADWIASCGDLRVRVKFGSDHVDSRYRGVFAEEIAVGMMAVVLQQRFGATVIWDMAQVVDRSAHKGVIADFLALRRSHGAASKESIVAECKGSLGNAVSAKRREHAEEQVDKTKVTVKGAPIALRLAVSSSIYFEGQSHATECFVKDPPEDGADNAQDDLDSVDLWRAAYSQTLRFIGLESAAAQVLAGRPASSLNPDPLREYFVEAERPREGEGVEMSEEDREARRAKQRTDERLQRLREQYRCIPLLDIGGGIVVMNTTVAAFLMRGIDGKNVARLEEYLLYGQQQPAIAIEEEETGSFVDPLGIGIIDVRQE